MSTNYLLDASALLALLQDEPEAKIVARHLASSAISSINLAEVASVLNKLGMQESEIHELFAELDITTIEFTRQAAIATGGIRKATAGHSLSLGDRACLVTAQALGCTVITADKAWLDYRGLLGVEIELIS